MQAPIPWITLPENRAATGAVECVADHVVANASSGGKGAPAVALFLHGPSGTGKTHLVSVLVAEVTRRCPACQVTLLHAGEFASATHQPEASARDGLQIRPTASARDTKAPDLLIVEDLQHLPARATERFVRLVDHCLTRRGQLVYTALVGPAQIVHLPARLTSRLGQGVVIGLETLSPASRLAFLAERARARQLAIDPAVLAWLAEHIPGSGRQLDGALTRVEGLIRVLGQVTVDLVREHFGEETRRLTVERIAQFVGRYFQVQPNQLRSRRRSRSALLPRQVGMYLARQLTPLSLQQIGTYFGGHDHTTVLHACRKVEQALTHDIHLSGAVRQLHADLA
jgi:chromosomal replication initiator protein